MDPIASSVVASWSSPRSGCDPARLTTRRWSAGWSTRSRTQSPDARALSAARRAERRCRWCCAAPRPAPGWLMQAIAPASAGSTTGFPERFDVWLVCERPDLRRRSHRLTCSGARTARRIWRLTRAASVGARASEEPVSSTIIDPAADDGCSPACRWRSLTDDVLGGRALNPDAAPIDAPADRAAGGVGSGRRRPERYFREALA